MSAITASSMISPTSPATGAPAAGGTTPAGQPSFSDALHRQNESARDDGKILVEGDKKPHHAGSKPAKPGPDDHQAELADKVDPSVHVASEKAEGSLTLVAPLPAQTLQQQALNIARESAAFRRNANAGAADALTTDAIKIDAAQASLHAQRTPASAIQGQAALRLTADAQSKSGTSANGEAATGSELLRVTTGLPTAHDGLNAQRAVTASPAGPAAIDRSAARLTRDDASTKLTADPRQPGARPEIARADGTQTPGALPGMTDVRQAAIAAIAEASERMTSRKSALEAPTGTASPAFTTATAQILQATPLSAAPTLQVATPFGAAEWGDAFGQQVAHLTTNRRTGMHTAELRLDPPDLGPIRVTLTIQDGIAHAAFSSAHGAVRQAIETSMSQLQQALAQSGIALGQSHVSDQGQSSGFENAFAQSQRNNGPSDGSTGQGDHKAGVGENGIALVLPTRAPRSLVDTFA